MNKETFKTLLHSFSKLQRLYDSSSVQQLERVLSELCRMKLPGTKLLFTYHNALLFTAAYPANERLHRLAEKELERLSDFVSLLTSSGRKDFLANSGIPGTKICASFSLELIKWLLNNYNKKVVLDSHTTDVYAIQGLLNSRIDPSAYEALSEERAGWKTWMNTHAPGRNKHELLKWFVHEFDSLSENEILKEHLFSQLECYVTFKTESRNPSLAFSRSAKGKTYFHTDGILRSISLEEALKQGKPKPFKLNEQEKTQLCHQAKGVLCSLLRETDTFTNANEKETELFDMGRGVSIALFYMKPSFKMALETYVGYLLFKNQVPTAYGGGWVLGNQSAFGINVFPPFRGGESLNILCQLLRLYHYHFGAQAFLVDPYQIGKGNPDGIQSASFWFYYKLGFRPTQTELLQLANQEFSLLKNQDYKTPSKTLRKLSNATMVWQKRRHDIELIDMSAIADKTSHFIKNNFAGNRDEAMKHARKKIKKKCGPELESSSASLKNLCVLLDALGVIDGCTRQQLTEIVKICSLKNQKEVDFVKALKQNKVLLNSLSIH